LKDADSTEFDLETVHPVIFKLRDLVTLRSGRHNAAGRVAVRTGDRLTGAGSVRRHQEIGERHRHRYEFNPEYRERLEMG
jgi:CTP synthase